MSRVDTGKYRIIPILATLNAFISTLLPDMCFATLAEVHSKLFPYLAGRPSLCRRVTCVMGFSPTGLAGLVSSRKPSFLCVLGMPQGIEIVVVILQS